MVNIGKKQFILEIFILVLELGLFGCLKEPANPVVNVDSVVHKDVNYIVASTSTEVKAIRRNNYDNIIYNIPKLNITLDFPIFDCNDFPKYNLPISDLQNYCNNYFGGNKIKEEYLKLVIQRSEKNIFFGYKNLNIVKQLFSKEDEKLIEKSLKLFNDYITKSPELYQVSIFLVDEIGKDEIAKWYFSENLKNITESELRYWNICEAGCPIYSKKIIGNYIVWQWGINPSSGAGDMCLRVTEPVEKFAGDKQIKCEIIAIIDWLIKEKVNLSILN